jgi:WbqC-like protein family
MSHKRIAILQSNYVPWKGYFDLIAAVDEFILYDEVQFTKNDWRNRNKIKTPRGVEWLSIPVGQAIHRRIRDVELPKGPWRVKHWNALLANYGRAPFFAEISAILEPVFIGQEHTHLSALNRALIEIICEYLGIVTRIRNSWDYTLPDGRLERLISLCAQAEAAEYITGPAAKRYIDEATFANNNIVLTWFDYAGYPEYPQLWGGFVHDVTILDLLFNCGKEAPNFMKHVRR